MRLAALLFVLSAIANAYAQIPSGNVFGGYSYLNADFAQNRASLNGWNATAETKILPFLSVVADFGGQYGSPDLSVLYPCPITNPTSCPQPPSPQTQNTSVAEHTFLFGPRFSLQMGKFRPYAQGIIGAGHIHESTALISASDTAFAYAFGVGVDYRITLRLGWRLGADALQTRFFNGYQTNVRVSTGIVVRF